MVAPGPYCEDMDSTPAPMPISIIPLRIAFAMSTQAWRPEEHCLLTERTAAVSGMPATREAARNSVAPPPGARTFPTEISSMREGSIWERESRDLRVWTRRSEAGTSLREPFPPLVRGVRRQQVTTISSGDLERMESRPRGMSDSEEERWEVTWERRVRAAGRESQYLVVGKEGSDEENILCAILEIDIWMSGAQEDK